jgi:hypothetical protein
MKHPSIVMTLVALLAACAKGEAPAPARGGVGTASDEELVETAKGTEAPAPAPGGVGATLDEKLVETARRVDGFGGMFFDDQGSLNVYLVERGQRPSAEALNARQTQVEEALTDVFGADFIAQGRAQRLDRQDTTQSRRLPEIKIIKGDYDVLQLVGWRADIDRALEVPGVVFTDVDEGRNRLKVGVDSAASREQVETTLRASGVPREAVIIEVTKPIKFLQTTLRDTFRPAPGGVQIEPDWGIAPPWVYCTMGFNARRLAVDGFVTNSHCTRTQGTSGDLNNTKFDQPREVAFTNVNKVGDERADPGYWVGSGVCPSGRRCRYSDSAFVAYTVPRGRDIARPTRMFDGETSTIDSTSPRFVIVGETSTFVQGGVLHKVGRTTGWSFGLVSGTCLNIPVADSDITLLCQHLVRRDDPNLGGLRVVAPGDSGSPVFSWPLPGANPWPGANVLLAGILWGGAEDGSLFLFSPMAQIERELGELTTFNFPSSPPPACPPGQKRCPTGQCVSQDRPCPVEP